MIPHAQQPLHFDGHRYLPYWGYSITADWQVWAHNNWRGIGTHKLTARMDHCGYPCVRLMVGGGERKKFRIHQLVALLFLPPKPSAAHVIRHLDGNPLNNDPGNIAWGTMKDNADDRERHGRTARGPEHGAKTLAGRNRRHIDNGLFEYSLEVRAK